jgi:ubiquinone/menaquinone biosynthesis C-methylase UbiE
MSEAAAAFNDGKAYERQMGRWSRLAGVAFLEWLAAPKDLSWLDVGCGNGAFTEELIARALPKSVMAIDPAEGQLAYARQREGTRMAEFRRGDAQALPFQQDSFDAAVMALVISFVPAPQKAVDEMARVVRPGGLVSAYVWDILGGGVPLRPLYAAFASLGFGEPVRPSVAASKLETMRELWENAGLRQVATHAITVPVRFDDFDDFWDSNTVPIGPQGKLLKAMSAGDLDTLRRHLRESLPIGADGRIAYEARANAIKGRVA